MPFSAEAVTRVSTATSVASSAGVVLRATGSTVGVCDVGAGLAERVVVTPPALVVPGASPSALAVALQADAASTATRARLATAV